MATPKALPRSLIHLTAFVAGFSGMGAEMAAGRLLAPYFGTSTLVWCLLIGSVLSALTVGAYVGGRLAVRPRATMIGYAALAGAGVLLALLPAVARPILRGAVASFYGGHVRGLLAGGALIGLLLVVPITVLGAMGPLLVHHTVREPGEVGSVAGRLGALGTAGSLLGTLLPGLVLVPWLGTERTFRLCGALLVAVGALGALGSRRLVLGVLVVLGLATAAPAGAAFGAAPGLVYEAESRYHYLQVTERHGVRRLYLNDGYAVQSATYLDGLPYFGTVWGYYALAPSFTTRGAPRRVLVLGLGGGTSARYYQETYPRAEIVGVELDPTVVEVARRYFGLPPGVEVRTGDARAFLARDRRHYDLIVVDAFRFPYVPFQLTTREFFELARLHLEPGGALMLNVGRLGEARDVVNAVARTLGTSFREVSAVDAPNASNTILVGTEHPLTASAGIAALDLPAAQRVPLGELAPLRPVSPPSSAPVLSDDDAPVEALTDRLVLGEIWRLLTRS